MQAYLIDPTTKTVSSFNYNGDWQTIAPAIGADVFDVVTSPEGFSVYVDDEGLYNSTDFFMWKGIPYPIAGRALVFGPVGPDGETTPIEVPMLEVALKLSFLDLLQVRRMAAEGMFDE